MAILAQRFLETEHDTSNKWCKVVRDALTLSPDLDRVAPRIVFDEDLHDVLNEMSAEKQLDFKMVCKHARMPAHSLWLEWHNAKTSRGSLDFGCYIRREDDGTLTCVLLNEATGNNIEYSSPGITMAFTCRPPPYNEVNEKTVRGTIVWSMIDRRKRTDQSGAMQAGIIRMVLRTMTFALFLLAQPKITSNEDIVYGPRLQRKRKEKGKPELLSYRKLHMKFGVLGSRVASAPGRASIATGEGERRPMKYHYVLGHFRTYHRGEPNEMIIWIEPYYRGDASAGVLIRERHLELKGAAP